MPIELGPTARIVHSEPLYAPSTDGGGGRPGIMEITLPEPAVNFAEVALSAFDFDTGKYLYTPDSLTEARERQDQAGQTVLGVGASSLDSIAGAALFEAGLQGAKVIAASPGEETRDESGQMRIQPRNQSVLQFLAQLQSAGISAEWVPYDATRLEKNEKGKIVSTDADRLINDVVAANGRIDSIIIAPGKMDNRPAHMIPPDTANELWRINYFGPSELMKAMEKQVMKQGEGMRSAKIVVLSSSSLFGNEFQTAYGGAKAAEANNVIAMANEFASPLILKKYPDLNIAINAIAPGLVDTQMTAKLPPEVKLDILRRTGATRQLHSAEVGRMIVKLLGPSSEGITGKIIPFVGLGPLPADLAA